MFIQLSKASNQGMSPSASFYLFDGYRGEVQDTAENMAEEKRCVNKVWP